MLTELTVFAMAGRNFMLMSSSADWTASKERRRRSSRPSPPWNVRKGSESARMPSSGRRKPWLLFTSNCKLVFALHPPGPHPARAQQQLVGRRHELRLAEVREEEANGVACPHRSLRAEEEGDRDRAGTGRGEGDAMLVEGEEEGEYEERVAGNDIHGACCRRPPHQQVQLVGRALDAVRREEDCERGGEGEDDLAERDDASGEEGDDEVLSLLAERREEEERMGEEGGDVLPDRGGGEGGEEEEDLVADCELDGEGEGEREGDRRVEDVGGEGDGQSLDVPERLIVHEVGGEDGPVASRSGQTHGTASC
eukprot:532573-Hanusia_phi.AAC.1